MSPYRAKGVVFLHTFAFFDARVPGGTKAVLAELPPATREFFEQPFLASSMYDLMPFLELTTTAARLAGASWRELIRTGAREQAERDLRGVYRAILERASPRDALERMSLVLSQYLSFAAVEGNHVSGTRYEGVATRIPRPLAPWMSAIAEGFIPPVLEAAGARDTTVIFHPFETSGEADGVELVAARFSITWSASPASAP